MGSSLSTLYIDFDAFFANVDKQLDPSIRDRPVGITALNSDYSALITRCYMAKAAGVKRGMRARDARELCPEIVIRMARPDVYVRVHNEILAEVERHLPVKKVWSVDEVECELIGREKARAQEIAMAMKAGLLENVGRYITPSIGLAPNQFLAKVAAEMEKPNGFTVLRREDLPGPLLNLSLTDLPGISEGVSARLSRAGITTVEGLWNTSRKQARAIWGNIEGERFWAQLHGEQIVRPETKRRMFGHSRVLSGQFKEPKYALDCLRLLTVKAGNRMRRENYSAGAMSVSFKTQDKRRWRGDASFAACRSDHALLAHMHSLFNQGLAEVRPKRLRHVYVMLHDIARPDQRPPDLFEEASDQKWDRLSDVMDGFNRKHGGAVLTLGPRAHIPGGYAGAKIAFGRVPDAEDFY
ncbi:MAG: Y-family DNA polymerase [Maricaulaceae bacterium]